MYLYDWMEQAKRDAENGGKGNMPTVFHKKNNADILATMRLDDWMQIYREWEAGRPVEVTADTAMLARMVAKSEEE